MIIPQEAVEAGAKAMSDDWNPDRDPILTAMFRDYATSALTAALPVLEQQIREYIAREIEAKAPLVYYPHESGYEKYQGMKYAAQVARGEDQP